MCPNIVKVELSNRRARLLGEYPFDAIDTLLKYRSPGWDYTPQGSAWISNKARGITDKNGKTPGWDGYKRLLGYDDSMGAGIFLALKPEMERVAMARFTIKDRRLPPSFSKFSPNGNSRPYQSECVAAMIEASGTGGLVLNATGCVDGHTYIECPRNLEKYPYGIPIKELVGKKPWVYCWNDAEQRITLGKAARVWKSGKHVPVYKVRFKVRGFGSRFGARCITPVDHIIATADHPFLLYQQKSGLRTNAGHHYQSVEYRELANLKPGDRVMALYRTHGSGHKPSYTHLYLNNGTKEIESRFVAAHVFGERSTRWHAHHEDENKLNHDVDNLKWKTNKKHWADHARKRNIEGTFGWQMYGEHPRGMKGKNQTAHQKSIARNWFRNLTEAQKAEYRNKISQASLRSWSARRENNHVVESVEFLGYRDVYNMTVPSYENFIANGVVTHNTGKTASSGLYLKCLKGGALFIVDELTLLKQSKAELENWIGEPVGEIGDSIFAPQRVTVGTVQTLHLHRFDKSYMPWTRTLQVIIIDEVHLALNRRNFETVKEIQPKAIFGLTATLELKKKHVALRAYDLCGPVIFEYPLEQGVREGYLAQGVALAVLVRNEIEAEPYPYKTNSWMLRRRWYRKTYREDYERYIVDGSIRNKLISALVRAAYKRGKYVVVLLERKRHLKSMSELLSDVPHELVFGEREVSDRVIAKDKFEKGDLRVLLCSKVFKKGINVRRIDLIIDGAAMKSRTDAVQKYGRGVRLADGKRGLIYLDIADVGEHNRFEKAARGRRRALKNVGIPVFKIDAEKVSVDGIIRLAEKKLTEKISGSEQQLSLNVEKSL